MKKFLAMLLSFVMMFSLTMPAMAAEVTGNTEGEVSGTFNPEIAFTGFTYVSDEIYTYDESTNTYTVIIPPNRFGVDTMFQITGKNLEYLEKDNTLLKVKENHSATGEYDFELEHFLSVGFEIGWSGMRDGSWVEYQYSNDGGITWSKAVRAEVKQSYYVTVNASENGSVTAKEYAITGETVTLNVSPAENYALESITVTDADGNNVPVENNQFTMPAKAVTVSATFKYAPKYNITVNDSENGSVSADMQTATAGTTVTVTVDPAEGYELDALTVNDGAVEVTKVDDTTYTFVMPDEEVTVNAVFELIPGKVTNVTVIVDGVEYTGPQYGSNNPVQITPSTKTVTVKLYGTYLDRLGEEAKVLVYVKEYPLYDGSWQFSEDYTTATMDIAPEVFADIDGDTFGHFWFMGETIDDDCDPGLFYQYEVRTFSITNDTAADANGTLNAPANAEECSTVTLTWTTDSAYTLKNIVVKDAEGNDVPITDKGLTAWTFVMPDSNVTVTATFEKLLVTSVEITWGSLAFTYDDTVAEGATEENGWTCAEGANEITVENTGETTFTAQAAYASYEGYESITGSFDPASKELAIDETYTFTLVLNGKPTKVLSGDKIGKVTITINEAAEG